MSQPPFQNLADVFPAKISRQNLRFKKLKPKIVENIKYFSNFLTVFAVCLCLLRDGTSNAVLQGSCLVVLQKILFFGFFTLRSNFQEKSF